METVEVVFSIEVELDTGFASCATWAKPVNLKEDLQVAVDHDDLGAKISQNHRGEASGWTPRKVQYSYSL